MKCVENKIQKAHISILMVCHGNICRSPMAEFVLKDMIEKQRKASSNPSACPEMVVASAATSTEEIGNPVHHGTRDILRRYGIDTSGKYARQMTKKDYEEYDYLIGMDQWNIRNMLRITGGDPDNKICRLLDFTDSPGDIADPWYTGDFEATYRDVLKGCQALLAKKGN